MGGGVIMIKVVGILMMISIIIAGIILYNLQNVKSRLISKMIVITLFLSGISIGLNYFFPETTFPFVLPLLVVLAAFVVCAMIWEAIQYPKTVARIIKQFTLPNVLFLLLVGSALFLTARLDLIQYILYCIGILGTMIFVLLVIEAKKKQENHEISLLADIPVESKEELVPSRQQDLIHIKRLLEINNYREPFALMINDDWGTGKTSLINVLMKDLEEEGHYIIFMQPMVWDDQHKMMDYFFSQLESLLYEKGIYTGKNSAFERYANLITQTLNTAHQSAVYGADLWKSFLGNQQPTNYREQKKQLEEDIGLLLGEVDKHIYLIVDDCDRVDEGVFKQVLMFIKEVVNFRGIDVLFLMDESKVAANDETLTPEYLEKFVNQKYKMANIELEELIKGFNEQVLSCDVKTDVYIKDLRDKLFDESSIMQIFEEIDKKIEGKNQKNIDEDMKKKFIQQMKGLKTNPRKLKMLIRQNYWIYRVIHEKNKVFKDQLYYFDVNSLVNVIIQTSIATIICGNLTDDDVENYIYRGYKSKLKEREAYHFLNFIMQKKLIPIELRNNWEMVSFIKNKIISGLLLRGSFNHILEEEIQSDLEKLEKQIDNLENQSIDNIFKLMINVNEYYFSNRNEINTELNNKVIEWLFSKEVKSDFIDFFTEIDWDIKANKEYWIKLVNNKSFVVNFCGNTSKSEIFNKIRMNPFLTRTIDDEIEYQSDFLRERLRNLESMKEIIDKLEKKESIDIEIFKQNNSINSDLNTAILNVIELHSYSIELYNSLLCLKTKINQSLNIEVSKDFFDNKNWMDSEKEEIQKAFNDLVNEKEDRDIGFYSSVCIGLIDQHKDQYINEVYNVYEHKIKNSKNVEEVLKVIEKIDEVRK